MREDLIPRFVRVPGREFSMGSDDGADDERPSHRVQVDTFFSSNPGMSSRIAHHLDFPDYSIAELMQMELQFGEFRVYLVEVCKSCHWNHLVHSFTLGDGVIRKPPRKKPTLEDEDYR
mgnify:CR=1 FL=1